MKNNELDVNQFLIRTDLAVETKQAVKDGQAGQTKEINGFIEKERDKGGIKVRTVDITKEGAELSGKSRDAMSRSRLKGFGNTTLTCRKK